MSPLAEPLPDGRYIIDPSKIGWEDVLRYEAALQKGPFPHEPQESYLIRCLKTLIGIPEPKDVYVERHEEAVHAMLKGGEG